MIDASNSTSEIDTYLESLVYLAKHHHREVSKESLTAGLTKESALMTPKLFQIASKSIGLIAKQVNRKISNIEQLILPAIIHLENNNACLLLEVNKENNSIKVILPENSMNEIEMSINDFTNKYASDVVVNIFIFKPTYNFNKRLQNGIVIKEPKKWFWNTMKKNKDIYALVIIAAIFINLFVIFIPLFTMNVYDRVLPNKAMDTLFVLFIGIVLVLVFDLILKLIRSYFLEQASKRADIAMSKKIFDQLLNIKLDSKPSSTGLFVSRLQSFEVVREFFTSATIALLVDIPFVIFFIAIIFYIGGPLAYVSVLTVILSLGFSFFMQRPIKKAIINSSKEDQIKQTTLTETATGLEIIKGVRAQNRMRTHWEKSINQTTYYGNKSIHLAQIANYVTGFVSQLSSVVIVAFGAYLASIGEISMGAIIASMMLNSRVIAPVSQIAGMIIRIDKTLLSLNNIDEIMQMPVERDPLKRYLSRPNLVGDIVFKEVTFAYKQRNYNVFTNINLHIKQGEKVGIIGTIGSGKSSLIKLLLNLYEPNSGSILFDNTDIRQIDPVDLRKAIGYVPQEAFLFMGTIRDNITIGNPYASDEEILKVSRISGVHDIIAKHEAGYDLIIGERGEGLSGGERQAVTLARAILSNPKILLLDEPTNSMDELSENNFKNKLKTVIADKTMIVVTHKPSILALVDRIIIVENGKIIADGPKDIIISKFNTAKKNTKKFENEK